jgi:high affinity sulfate transporter 1
MSEAATAGATAGGGRRTLSHLVPGLGVLRSYRRSWLPSDLIAGLVLTAVLIPVGMGYAEAAGLPAITGLYATIVPLLAYAVFGPSRTLVLGPDSSLVPLISAAILPLAAGDQARAVELAGLLAIIVAVLIAGAGFARFGFITELLSNPVRQGYLHGIALIVLVGQLGKLFGFSVQGEDLIAEIRSWVEGLAAGLTEPVALVIGAGSLAVILGFRRWAPHVPGVLIAVVGATLVSAVFDLAARSGIAVVGPLPQGLPSFGVPPVSIADIGALLPAAIGIAFVSAADTSVLSRAFASRSDSVPDPDQELVALGTANLAAGLFGGFPISSSSSRTPVALSAGAKTQLTCVVGAATIAVLLVIAPDLLAPLPQAALGAVVFAAALGLIDLPAMARLWAARRSEFFLALASFAGVAFIGVVQGIFIAVALSLAAFIQKAWHPHDAVLGRATGVKGYHDVTFYPEARRIPGLLLYRFDAPLFFANADVFRDRILTLLRPVAPPIRWVIVAAEPITDVDTTAAEMLETLDAELRGRGLVLAFAELKDPVRVRLERYGTIDRLGGIRVYPTIGTAVDAYLDATGEAWVDWEEGLEDLGTPPGPEDPTGRTSG